MVMGVQFLQIVPHYRLLGTLPLRPHLSAYGGFMRGGDIRMADNSRYRPEELKIRFTKNEKEYVRDRAESVNMTMTAYARKIMLDGAIIYRDVSLYSKYLYELNAIGKNINQIAHNTNSLGITTKSDVTQLKQQFDRLKELYIQLLGDIT